MFITNWITNLDVIWEEPSAARFFDELSTMGRVIMLDKRGSGVSDHSSRGYMDPVDDTVCDVNAVLDVLGSEQAVLIGDTEGGMLCCVLSASNPQRFPKLILVNSLARLARDEDYPIGAPPEIIAEWTEGWHKYYGVGAETLVLTAPAVANDRRFGEWYVRYQRLSMAPSVARQALHWITETDVRAVLPSIQARTLVIHRRDALFIRLAYGEYLAAKIPGAQIAVVEGAETHPFHAGDSTEILGHIQSFITGESGSLRTNRQLTTVLFSDIVGSTELASRLGDQGWLDLRTDHNRLARIIMARFGGREWATTGDGFVATFDGPNRAVQCALAMTEDLERLGVSIRVGIHTGEVELRADEIGGIAMHIAARVMAEAQTGGVMVSGTVKDLVVGAHVDFIDRGLFQLKGVPGSWSLFEARAPAS